MKFITLIILSLIFSCGNKTETEKNNYTKIKAKKSTYFATGEVGASVNYRGYIGVLENETIEQKKKMNVYTSGVMFAKEHGGNIEASMAWYQLNLKSISGEDTLGIYHVRKDDVLTLDPNEWKRKHGPVYADGSIKVYGDEMVWMSLQADNSFTESLQKKPVQDVRLEQAVYTFNRPELQNTYFIRYDFTNIGTSELKNLYTGFYHDPDVVNYLNNHASFDQENEIVYYVGKDSTKNEYTVIGYTFLLAPKVSQSNYGVNSSREMFLPGNSEFNEPNEIGDPKHILNMLKGLSNSGQSMKNPITNENSRYAYTGDIVAETGWRSGAKDIRGILGAEPIDLQVNETKSLVICYVQHKSTSLQDAIDAMKAQIKLMRLDQSILE